MLKMAEAKNLQSPQLGALEQLLQELNKTQTLTELALQREPFTIRRPVYGPYTKLFQPFSTILSETSATGAWQVKTPFLPARAKWHLDMKNTGSQSYAQIVTTYERHGKEHLSAAVGVGVGNELLGAEVSVQYDRTVMDNADGFKASTRRLVRLGMLTYGTSEVEQPKFSAEASNTLFNSVVEGTDSFTKMYGDCFVGGLIIGGEVGVLFSQGNRNETTVDVTKLNIQVNILFMSFSKTFTKTSVDYHSLSEFRITTFDTTKSNYRDFQPGESSIGSTKGGERQATVSASLQTMERLAEQIQEDLDAILQDKTSLDDTAQRLDQQKLVFEVLMVPYASLAEYVEIVVGAEKVRDKGGIL